MKNRLMAGSPKKTEKTDEIKAEIKVTDIQDEKNSQDGEKSRSRNWQLPMLLKPATGPLYR